MKIRTLRIFICLLAMLTAANASAARDVKQQPTTRPEMGTRSIVSYPFPPASEYNKFIGPIVKRYGFPSNAESFHELREVVLTRDGRMHAAPAGSDVRKLDPETADYTLFVPDTLTKDDPAAGVLVYISPGEGDRADVPPAYRAALAKHKLIFIAPHDVQNGTHSVWRVFMALEAVRNIKREFPLLDRDRIYVSGMSGGGRISSHVAQFFPDIFGGCLAMCGSNFYRDTPVPNGKRGEIWPGFWPSPDQALLKRARADSRIVLFTGSEDFNRDSTKAFVEMFKTDKFAHIAYLEQPGIGHELPSAEFFEKGLQSLDEPLFSGAEELFKRAAEFETRRKFGDAILAYESAARHGSPDSTPKPFVAEAQSKAAALRTTFDTRLATIEKLIEGRQLEQAVARVRDLRTDYGPLAVDRAAGYLDQIKQARATSRPTTGGASNSSPNSGTSTRPK